MSPPANSGIQLDQYSIYMTQTGDISWSNKCLCDLLLICERSCQLHNSDGYMPSMLQEAFTSTTALSATLPSDQAPHS